MSNELQTELCDFSVYAFIGIILHYDDPNQDLRDLYFISPSWLCDFMAKVVSVGEAHSFIKDRMLFEKDIPFIIDENRRFPKAFYPQYLRLLARLQIACRVDIDTVLLPSRLPSTNPGENLSFYDLSQTLTRIHSFSYIPNGFWDRFICRFLFYLNEMLNVGENSFVHNSYKQKFTSNHGEEDADENNGNKKNSPIEVFEFRSKDAGVACSGESGTSTLQNAVHTSEHDMGLNDDQPDRLENRILSSDSYLADSDTTVGRRLEIQTGRRAYVQHVRTQTAIQSFSRVNSQGISSFDAPPSDSKHSSSEVSPILLAGNSHLPTRFSSCSQDNYRASFSNVFDHTDSSIMQTNLPSYESWTGEGNPVPRQVVTGPSSPFPQAGQGDGVTDDAEHIFDGPVDLRYLLSHRYLVCWRKGVLFRHPQLYLSVSLLSSGDGRELIQTKVSCTRMGYKALAFIVDHIRTLVKEWFPGMDGTDRNKNPHVSQLAPCPTCQTLGVNSPYHFNVVDCLKESLTRDYMICGNSHTPQSVKLSELCPDLLCLDLGSSVQLKACDVKYAESVKSLLGRGGYGKVYNGTYNGRAAAIKVFNFKLEENPADCKTLNHFYEARQEAAFLSRIRHHPNVISFYGVAERPKFCIVIELATKGTLREVLKAQTLKRIVVYRIAQQIASAVAHLHSCGIIHRDLKSDNVLMFSLDNDSEVNIKLVDFGTANFVDPVRLKPLTGTPGFIAPEILEYSDTEEYSEMVDVYSYAMVLYELISRRRPFQELQNQFEINAMVKEGKRPAVYDLPDIKVRFLTLTELMVTCWAQEAAKRPNMKDVCRQMKSPSFFLLYGKILLRKVNSPRQLCFLQGKNEVWISCDDRTGASVLVVDLVNSEIKQKFIPEIMTLVKAKESFFNIIGIHDIDKQHVAIILRSTLDYVSIYSKDRKRLVDSYQVLDHYIRSLTVCENYVVLGCDDGCFSIVPKRDFLRGRLEKLFITVNKSHAISSIIIDKFSNEVDAKIILGCDKCIYKYPFSSPDFEQVHPSMTPTNEKKIICEMHVSEDGTMLFMSHIGSPIISTILIDSMTQIGEIDCSHEVKILEPNSDVNDQRVATFCVSNDTLWVGTGSGHILLYEIKEDRTLGCITWLKPYEQEVRSLISCSSASSDTSSFVLSIGKDINLAAFCCDMIRLWFLTSSFPLDTSVPAVQQRNICKGKCGGNDSFTFNRKSDEMLLVWDATDAMAIKKVVHHGKL